ncbi:MAG: hypothetical protein K0R28_6550, partial [Paenibacillus sp.]|nr:hypothetical protein [Paenibacillus sp.]
MGIEQDKNKRNGSRTHHHDH